MGVNAPPSPLQGLGFAFESGQNIALFLRSCISVRPHFFRLFQLNCAHALESLYNACQALFHAVLSPHTLQGFN